MMQNITKRSRRFEHGASILEFSIGASLFIVVLFTAVAIFAYSHSFSVENMQLQSIADIAEGQKCLWLNEPGSSEYTNCLSQLRASAEQLVPDAFHVSDTATLSSSKFAILRAGQAAYFPELGIVYRNDTFICTSSTSMATIFAPSPNSTSNIIFCSLDTNTAVSVPSSEFSQYVNNPLYRLGSCNSSISGDCIPRGSLTDRQLIAMYPTEVIAMFPNHIPYLSFLPNFKVKKLIIPKVLTSKDCEYTFDWTGEWGPCEGAPQCTAGNGIQQLIGTCVRRGCSQPDTNVDASFCNPVTMPTGHRTCPIPALPQDSWLYGSWSLCPANICGGGDQTRVAICDDINSDNHFCCDPTTKPADQIQACPNSADSWVLGDWSTCNATCGHPDTQTRSYQCGTDGLGQCCTGSQPASETQTCEVLYDSWSYDAWSACPANVCGGGSQTSSASCQDTNGDGITCCSGTQPADQVRSCPVITDSWVLGDWSTCNATCGHPDTQTRSYQCGTDGLGQCCTGSQPASETQTCTAPCEPSCVYVAAWAGCSGTAYSNGSGFAVNCANENYSQLSTLASNYTVTDPGSVPSCFNSFTSGRCNQNLDDGSGVHRWGWCHGDGSDTFSWNGSSYDVITPRTFAQFLGDPNWASLPAGWQVFNDEYYPNGWDYQGVHHAHQQHPYTAYMDENCNFLSSSQQPENTRLCGFLGVSWSPISLLWTKDASIDGDGPVVQFALNPNKPELSMSVWKASAETPLLVYDPKHTGVITSAEQLFGNYTFGGRVVNLAKALSSKAKSGKSPWSNGYEALALFDRNNDGEVSGEELQPLALWFDKNKNGVSEPGEVRPLLNEGVTMLYYTKVRVDSATKNVHLDVGFKRKIGGTEFVGASVDWYAETFANAQDAYNGLTGKSLVKTVSAATSDKSSARPIDKIEKSNKIGPDLHGIWAWHILEKGGETRPGFFAINDIGDKVFGLSAVEIPLAKNDRNLKSSIRYLALNGKKRVVDGNNVVMDMVVYDPEASMKAESTITVHPSGKKLEGITTQTFASTSNNKAGSVKYSWEAAKFE